MKRVQIPILAAQALALFRAVLWLIDHKLSQFLV
jgi:hypothetical protein